MEHPDETFEDALKRFQGSLTEKQRTEFKACSLQDVKDTIRKVETSLCAQRRQRNLQRMSRFVEGMNQLGQVVEVFLNVDATVAFVWAPIKFVLLAASTWVETLDCLLDTYSEIGDVLPGLTRYKTLLEKHPFIKVHLEKYYCAVLEFHRKALDVFSRPNWKMAFHSAWKTFRTKFTATLQKLKRYRDLLSDEKITAAILEVQDFRLSIEEKLDELARKVQNLHIDDSESAALKHQEQLEKKRQFVLSKLDPPDYEYDFERASKERRGTSSGHWVLNNSTFQEWIDMTTSENRTLYVHGIPGTGKTILASWVVEHLKQVQRNGQESGLCVSVVYFFFRHSQPEKRDITGLLLSLVSQLVSQDEVLLDLICQKLLSVDQQTVRSESLLRDLAAMAIQSQRMCFAVIDGLDECLGSSSSTYKEAQVEILDWFESVLSTDGGADKATRLLISAQRNGCLEDRLIGMPSIQLERADAHLTDIKVFADAKSVLIQQKFSKPSFFIDEKGRAEIVDRVCFGAKGMFLYAKIVLSNLLSQISVGHFKRELRSEIFPKGLDEAYERVVINVLENPNEAERDASRGILGLIVGAERPLMWKEIQSYFCILIDDEVADPDFQLDNSCKHFCGSLVEMETDNTDPKSGSEGRITLVHETARQYLLNTRRLSFEQEDSNLALFCARYLSSSPFCLGNESRIKEHVTTGYYGFVDYAAANWWKHIARLSKSTVLTDTFPVVILQAVGRLQATGGAAATDKLPSLRQQIHHLANDGRGWEETFPIESRVKSVRSTIESLFADKSVMGMENVQQLYGQLSYKCHKPWCHYFLDGFKTIQKRDDHVSEHERPFRCDSDGCFGQVVGFSTEIELSRHNSRLHNNESVLNFPSIAVGPSKKCRFNIIKAAADGNLDRVQECVERGAIINRVFNWSFPLLTAVQNGQFEVCQYLLEQDADVNMKGRKGITALHEAARRNDSDIAKLLISHGAPTNTRDDSGSTPIFVAKGIGSERTLAAFPNESIVHKMCRGPICSSTSPPLDLGQSIYDDQTSDSDILDMIREGCFDLNYLHGDAARNMSRAGLAINLALVKNRNIIANTLIESGQVDLNRCEQGYSTLHFACLYSTSKEIIEKLLSKTRFPDSMTPDGQHILELVCRNMNLLSPEKDIERRSILSTILESGRCNINAPVSWGRPLLHRASENGYADLAELLLHHTTAVDTPDPTGMTPLDLAIEKGHIGVIDVLLSSGKFDANKTTMNGDLPLHVACREGLGEAVKSLLPRTQNINAEDRDGRTPLEIAMRAPEVVLLELLLESGRFDLDKPNRDGDLPLHIACRGGWVEPIRLILPQTQMVETEGGGGATALELAITGGDAAVVELLLESGRFDLDSPNQDGDLPLHLACNRESIGTVKLIWHHMHMSVFSLVMRNGAQDVHALEVLLQSGEIDVNKPDSEGHLPLHLATIMNNEQAVKLLLPMTQDIHTGDSKGMTPLGVAVENGHVDIVNMLLEFNSQIVIIDNTAREFLSLKRDFTILDAVFSLPRFVHMGLTPLHWGAWSADPEIIQDQIVKNGKDYVHPTPRSIPSGWAERLRFDISPAMRAEWRTILLTPMFLGLNTTITEHRNQERTLSSIFADRIWDHLAPTTSGINLSGLCQYPISVDRLPVVAVAFNLVHATMDERLYRHMAGAGLSLPWNLTSWESSSRSFHVIFNLPGSTSGADGLPGTCIITQKLLLAIVCGPRCNFIDVITTNFDLANDIMSLILDDMTSGYPGKPNFDGIEDNIGLLTFIHQQPNGLSALGSMIQLGMNGFPALRHASMVGWADLVRLLVATGMLDSRHELRDETGATACDVAIRAGNLEISKFLKHEGFQFSTNALPLVVPSKVPVSLDFTADGGLELDYLDDILNEYTSPNNETSEEGYM